MSLTRGSYVVTSVEEDRVIGRPSIEPSDMSPKQVFALPVSEGKTAPPVRPFNLLETVSDHISFQLVIEQTAKGFVIKAKNDLTGVQNKALLAFPQGGKPEHWVLTPRPESGKGNVFTYVKGCLWLLSVYK